MKRYLFFIIILMFIVSGCTMNVDTNKNVLSTQKGKYHMVINLEKAEYEYPPEVIEINHLIQTVQKGDLVDQVTWIYHPDEQTIKAFSINKYPTILVSNTEEILLNTSSIEKLQAFFAKDSHP